MRRNLLITVFALSLFALGGCKSKEEKACSHAQELMEQAISSLPAEQQQHARDTEMQNFQQQCMEHVQHVGERCSNPGDVLDCMIGAANMDAAEACEHVCQATGEGSH